MLRHGVLNVLRLDKSVFGGISVKRKGLAWDDDKLLKAGGGGIGREEDFKATASNPRGLDARAFTKRTGAPDECALDTS